MPSGSGYPMFIVGVPRVGNGNVPNSTYRPDLWNGGSPKLDSSVVGGPNRVWGLRTNGDAYLVSQASAFSHGGFQLTGTGAGWPDNWAQTKQITIEFAIEGFAGGQVPGGTQLFGLGANGYGPSSPFTLCTSAANAFTLLVSTQAVEYGPVSNSILTFSSGSATGVQRIAIQIDLVAGAVTAFVNGTQVAVTGTAPSAGLNLNENPYWPFVINALYDGSNGSCGADFALYGLCLSRSIRYANNGNGQAQVPNPQIYGTSANDFGTATLVLTGSPTGGTYTITYGGQTTTPISATATPAQVQAALQALSSIGAGNVTVTGSIGGLLGTEYAITAANGFTFTGGAGLCSGGNLTGGVLQDSYRYYPSSTDYNHALFDPFAIAHLGFTENPSGAAPPPGRRRGAGDERPELLRPAAQQPFDRREHVREPLHGPDAPGRHLRNVHPAGPCPRHDV